MKRVRFNYKTLEQLRETINVAVDVKNGDIKGAITSAKTETDRTVGPSVERNYVIPGDEINEESRLGDPFEDSVERLLSDIGDDPDMEDLYKLNNGSWDIPEVMDTLSDYYSEYTGGKRLQSNDTDYAKMEQTFLRKVGRGSNSFGEGKVYSKKKVEERRLANIKKYGTVSTKKEIEEKFAKHIN